MTKRLVVIFSLLLVVGSSTDAWAIREFKKAFKERYVRTSEHAQLETHFKKVGCYTCHIKGEKKEARNDYGEALSQFIEGDAGERLKAAKQDNRRKEELAAVEAELQQAFEQVEKLKHPCGETYGEIIASGRLPLSPDQDVNEESVAASDDADDAVTGG